MFLQESLDNITLFSIITIMSLFLLAPVTFFMEGVKITPSYLQAAVSKFEILAIDSIQLFICPHNVHLCHMWCPDFFGFACQGLDVRQVYTRSLLAALCFHAYQQVRNLFQYWYFISSLCLVKKICFPNVLFSKFRMSYGPN